MPAKSPQPFPGFKHVCVIGMSRGGLDDEIRTGLLKFRGQNHKWLLHDMGRYCEGLAQVESGELECDLFVGKVLNIDLRERLEALGRPVLDLARSSNSSAWRTHGFDQRAVGAAAAKHLASLGHRNFAFFCYEKTIIEAEMWEGFRTELCNQAEKLMWLCPGEKVVWHERPSPRREALSLMANWFPKMPRPLAVFSHNDLSSATLAELAFFSGVSVPEEMALLSCGNTVTTCESCHPSLSSIAMPGEKLGFLIGEQIQQLFAGESTELRLLAPSRVVERHSTAGDAVDDPIVAQALAMMRRDAAERITIGEIIDRLPVSKRSFNDRFLKAMGRTPREELFRLRVEMAKERLLRTDQTVYHIALDCGFTDAENLGQYFKRATGRTPTAFRKENAIQR